jgi:hypothetical protein
VTIHFHPNTFEFFTNILQNKHKFLIFSSTSFIANNIDASVGTTNHIVTIVGLVNATSSVNNAIAFATSPEREPKWIISAAQFVTRWFSVDGATSSRDKTVGMSVNWNLGVDTLVKSNSSHLVNKMRLYFARFLRTSTNVLRHAIVHQSLAG